MIIIDIIREMAGVMEESMEMQGRRLQWYRHVMGKQDDAFCRRYRVIGMRVKREWGK